MSMEWIAMPMVTHPQLRPQECQSLILTQALRATISDISAQPDAADAGWFGGLSSGTMCDSNLSYFPGIRIDTYIGDWVPLFFSDRN